MTDTELRAFFGLSVRALDRLRATRKFPVKDSLINKTDRRAVDIFFDRRCGILPASARYMSALDREENFSDE
ncbi:hypothetical protein X750_16810 [Mesorhizobium sp. LNJC394B00]|nr:hypothetical protein X750_16810 [Mesorhizobium sp. LNJC394B00]